jgi:hypothetical protein
MQDRSKIKGKVTATVFTSDGEIKRYSPMGIRKLLGLKGRRMICVSHNIITDEGDALVADVMSNTPVRTKIVAAAGFMPVGVGWTGTLPKTNGWVNTITGAAHALTATYPILKGSWGGANDNVLIYKAIYEAGTLNATGINECAITSHATDISATSCLAYAQITPACNVTSSDTLDLTWEITFLGS